MTLSPWALPNADDTDDRWLLREDVQLVSWIWFARCQLALALARHCSWRALVQVTAVHIIAADSTRAVSDTWPAGSVGTSSFYQQPLSGDDSSDKPRPTSLARSRLASTHRSSRALRASRSTMACRRSVVFLRSLLSIIFSLAVKLALPTRPKKNLWKSRIARDGKPHCEKLLKKRVAEAVPALKKIFGAPTEKFRCR